MIAWLLIASVFVFLAGVVLGAAAMAVWVLHWLGRRDDRRA